MKTKQVIARITLAIVIATAIFTIVITPWIIKKASPEMGIYTGSTAGILIFIFLLEVKASRFPKGMLLISYGVLFQVFFTMYYFQYIDRNNPYIEDLKVQLDLYMQVLLFACAGAGGSIIANYADKSSSDYEQKQPISNTIDNTKHIDRLIANTNKIERKVNLSIIISFASSIVTALIAIVLLFK